MIGLVAGAHLGSWLNLIGLVAGASLCTRLASLVGGAHLRARLIGLVAGAHLRRRPARFPSRNEEGDRRSGHLREMFADSNGNAWDSRQTRGAIEEEHASTYLRPWYGFWLSTNWCCPSILLRRLPLCRRTYPPPATLHRPPRRGYENVAAHHRDNYS